MIITYYEYVFIGSIHLVLGCYFTAEFWVIVKAKDKQLYEND